MTEFKPWYHSKTVWGGLIAVAAPLIELSGARVDAGTQAELADMLVALTGAIGGLVAIWGRLTARSSIA